MDALPINVAVLLFVVLLITSAGVLPLILKLKLVAVAALPTLTVTPVMLTVPESTSSHCPGKVALWIYSRSIDRSAFYGKY